MDKIVLGYVHGVSASRRQIFSEGYDEFVLKETVSNSLPRAFLSITNAWFSEPFPEVEFKLTGPPGHRKLIFHAQLGSAQARPLLRRTINIPNVC